MGTSLQIQNQARGTERKKHLVLINEFRLGNPEAENKVSVPSLVQKKDFKKKYVIKKYFWLLEYRPQMLVWSYCDNGSNFLG